MGMSLKRGAPAMLCATLAGVLLAGASTAAFAAPAKAAPAKVDAAKLEALQRQLDDMRAQMQQMQSQASQDSRVSVMQQQLDAITAQLNDIKTAQASAAADIDTLKLPPAASAVTATLSNGKPAFATQDGRFTANLRAVVMFDAGKYFQKSSLPAAVSNRDLNDGANFRRARFGIDGKLFRDFDYTLIYEFGGSGAEDAGHIQEAWIQYTALKPFRIRLGAFEPNIGLAAATSTSGMALLERPSSAEIARNVAAGDSRSALQVQANGLWGEGDTGIGTRWFFSTALTGNTVGTINSTGSSNAQPFDEQTAWIGRLAIAPFAATDWQAHLGVNYQRVLQPNDAGAAASPRYPVQLRERPELRIDGTRLIDTGALDAKSVSVLGGEAAFGFRNVLLEGEYFKYDIDRRGSTLRNPKFDGWYLQGSWVLTGETRVYNPTEARYDAPKPNYNFSPDANAWGAFELAARYSVVNLNDNAGALGTATPVGGIRGGEQKITTVGVNWYLNPTIRLMLDYQNVDVNRLNAAGVQIGQSYNAVAARAQFSF